jgi:peptidoglycan/LPS O-acetylase OafA/YrhL
MSHETPPRPLAPSDPHELYLQRNYFPELDGLRALCALLVITAHLYSHKEWWVWLAGTRGVSVFFVLSGFLITTLALREEKQRGQLSLTAFYMRRSCRLFPLYYLVLALYCLLLFGLGQGTSEQHEALWEAIPWNLIYCQEVPFYRLLVLDQRDLPFFQGWSLGIEEKFYLFWPLIGFVLWRGSRRRRLRGTAILAAIFVGGSIVFSGLDANGRVIGRFLYSFYPILIGCLAAFLLHDRSNFERIRGLVQWGRGIPALLVFLLIHFATPWLNGWLREALHVVDPLATVGLMAGLLTGAGAGAWFLRSRPLVFVGRLSYGVYLLHLLAMGAVYRLLPTGLHHPAVSIVAFILCSLLSILGAWILSLAVESPCIRLGRRWSQLLNERSSLTPRPECGATGG